jgi:hypothetical protein
MAVVVALVGCTPSEPPSVLVIHPGVLVPALSPVGPPCCAPGAADEPPLTERPPDQPPEIKLELGHYSNTRVGIGAVIDRTGREALLRYDGTGETLHLVPTPGQFGRVDYEVSGNHVVMQAWPDGRIVVHIAGSEDGIPLRRDGDADPL